MKTSTIVKLSAAIFLCIIFLALIGKKTRENFDSMNQSYGNANPDESRSMNINGSGYPISAEDDNHLSNLNLNKRHELPTNRFCTLSNKTDEDRNAAIQREATEAKQQLDAYLKKKMEEKVEIEQKQSQPPADPCTYLRFPGILS